MTATLDISVSVDTAALDAMIARIEALPRVVEKYATLIADEAKRLVPVRTGALQASIAVTLDGLVAEITAGDGLTYASFIEYGTARMASRPYIRPAFERYAAAFVDEVQAILNGA